MSTTDDTKPEISATPAQIEAAFTEWERRYRANPEAFFTEQEKTAQSAETYGQQAAPYFIEILSEI